MFQFRRFPSCTYLIQCRIPCGGFPHSEISGSLLICSSPKLIAAYHVLHRLLMPRHSPCALFSLTFVGISIRTLRFRPERSAPAENFALLRCPSSQIKTRFAGLLICKEYGASLAHALQLQLLVEKSISLVSLVELSRLIKRSFLAKIVSLPF